MARKKKNNIPSSQNVPLQNTTQIDTDQFVKGMVKDTNDGLIQAGNWSHARNAINNSATGDAGVIGNEPANLHCAEIPYTVIGGIHLYGDKWAMFSTNNIDSEIGLFDDSHCTYETIVNDQCLAFNKRHLVTGAAKENFDCTWQIYWDDGLNPSRTLNIDDVAWVQVPVGGPDIDGSPCVVYADAEPLRLDCERIRLAPLMDIPCIELNKAKDGGLLKNGSYQAFLAYSKNGVKVTDYLGTSNLQPIWSHDDNQGSLIVSFSNLDNEDFEEFELVICSQIKGEVSAKSMGIYSTEDNEIVIDYINPDLVSVGVELLPLRTPAYEKSDKMYVVNDYLIRQGPYEQFDFNYQPIANNIRANWVSVEYPANYYHNGGNKPTFMRDEQYAFFIRWIYNTGEKSKSYHIPGRAPDTLGGLTGVAPGGTEETDMMDTIAGDPNTGAADITNSLGTEIDRWQTDNTAVQDNSITSGTPLNTVLPDGGRVVGKGWMGYWESTEQYPMDPVVWDQLCGENIRHHKMPDEQTRIAGTTAQSPFTQRNSGGIGGGANDNQLIYILGVEFDNISWPTYNNGLPITNIVGYEILTGSRDGNRSIIAKGIGRNMRGYPIDGQTTSTVPNTTVIQGVGASTGSGVDAEGAGTMVGVIPNYPYNDVLTDPYLKHEDYFTGGITNHEGADNPGLDLTRRDMFTFHSPETSINRIFLNPSEIKHYGFSIGRQLGRFKKSEEHPQNKLIRDVAVMISAIIGGGYALQQLQGEKIKKSDGGKALSLNQNPRSGGGGTLSPSTAVATGIPPVATVTTGTLTLNADGGNQAPGNNAAVALTARTDLGTHLANNVATESVFATAITDGIYTASTLVGGTPAQQLAVTANQTAQTGNLTGTPPAFANNVPGYVGPSVSNEIRGSRSKSLPTLIQALSSLMQFLSFMSTGGQEVVDLIYNLISYQDYVLKYNSHGLYSYNGDWNNMQGWNGIYRSICDRARYVKGTMQNFDANTKINNLHRPSTVVIRGTFPQDGGGGAGFDLPGITAGINLAQFIVDQSKLTVGNVDGLTTYDAFIDYGRPVVTAISAHYMGLKLNYDNQYGQIDGIKQIPYSCPFYPPPVNIDNVVLTGTDPIADAIALGYNVQLVPFDNNGDGFPDGFSLTINGTVLASDVNINQIIWDPLLIPYYLRQQTLTSGIVFGGDAYINRYTEKVIMPFFWDFLKGQPDQFPYDYRLYANVPFPRYWMDTKKYDMSELVSGVTSFDFAAFATGGAGLPSLFHDLECSANDIGMAYNNTPFTGTTTVGGGGGGATSGGHNSLFLIKHCYMYTHNSGANDFFCESELNVAFRDWGEEREKRHYDWTEYTDIDELFHADIIRDGNYYQYDNSLSKNKFFNQLISFGITQDRSYNPVVAEECFTHYPKRLIYSLRAQHEAKLDYWRVFLPNNYKDFKNVVNVVKPISQSGALILFPHLSPVKFQGVDQLTTDLKTKLTIGDGGLFGNPMQNVTNADLPHEYGSCESARSVINTPSGLYYISQAQGKIFHYGGQGLENIGDKGLKQWLNKYLPCRLLAAYPEIETADHMIDNPVVGVGCQSVYDPNYDLVYFCKKDYEPLNPCVEFNEETGEFVYNQTECDGAEQIPVCPAGYIWNENCDEGVLEEEGFDGPGCCENINIVEADFNPGSDEIPGTDPTFSCLADITIVIDFSISIRDNGRIGTQRQMLYDLINAMSADLDSGATQLTLMGFADGVMLAQETVEWGNTWIGPNYAQQVLNTTSVTNEYLLWVEIKTQECGANALGNGNSWEYPNNCQITHLWTQYAHRVAYRNDGPEGGFITGMADSGGVRPDSIQNGDGPYPYVPTEGGSWWLGTRFAGYATNIAAGYWNGLRMAFHPAALPRPNIPKHMIMMYDGMHNRGQVRLGRLSLDGTQDGLGIMHNNWAMGADVLAGSAIEPPGMNLAHHTWGPRLNASDCDMMCGCDQTADGLGLFFNSYTDADDCTGACWIPTFHCNNCDGSGVNVGPDPSNEDSISGRYIWRFLEQCDVAAPGGGGSTQGCGNSLSPNTTCLCLGETLRSQILRVYHEDSHNGIVCCGMEGGYIFNYQYETPGEACVTLDTGTDAAAIFSYPTGAACTTSNCGYESRTPCEQCAWQKIAFRTTDATDWPGFPMMPHELRHHMDMFNPTQDNLGDVNAFPDWVSVNVINNPIYQNSDPLNPNPLNATLTVTTLFLATPTMGTPCYSNGEGGPDSVAVYTSNLMQDNTDNAYDLDTLPPANMTPLQERFKDPNITQDDIVGYTKAGVPILHRNKMVLPMAGVNFITDRDGKHHEIIPYNPITDEGLPNAGNFVNPASRMMTEGQFYDGNPCFPNWPDHVNGAPNTVGYGQWVENNQMAFNDQIASSPDNAFYLPFEIAAWQDPDNPNGMNALLTQFCTEIPGDPPIPATDPSWSCPCGEFIGDPNDMSTNPMCDCSDYTEPTYEDVVFNVDITDPDYFKDCSWTLSYDPKIKGWISFHDWHPDLTFPSHNHFLTSKDVFGLATCPENYFYNPDTGMCEQAICPQGLLWDPEEQSCCRPTSSPPTVVLFDTSPAPEEESTIKNRSIDFDSQHKRIEGSEFMDFVDDDGKTTMFTAPFTPRGVQPVTNVASNTVFVKILNKVIQAVTDVRPRSFAMEIPFIGGHNLTLPLQYFNVVRKDFKVGITKEKGKITEVEYVPQVVMYKIVSDDIKGSVTVLKNKIWVSFRKDGKQYEIKRVKDDEYALFNINDLRNKQPFGCGTVTDVVESAQRSMRQARSSITGCIDIAVDIDYYTYQTFGFLENDVADWVTGITAAVSEIYSDQLGPSLSLKYVHIWGISEDPYYDVDFSLYPTDSAAYLFAGLVPEWTTNPNFTAIERNYTVQMTRYPTGGGIAYGIGGLCDNGPNSPASYGVCGSMAETFDDDTDAGYQGWENSWNINVVAHELGHTIGAHHTQQCGSYAPDPTYGYAYDGSTGYPVTNVIDNCAAWASSFQVCTGITSADPNPVTFYTDLQYGTIMSYCHIPPNTDMTFEFHPIIIDQRIDPVLEFASDIDCLVCEEEEPIIEVTEPIEGTCDCPLDWDGEPMQRVFISTGEPASVQDCLQCNGECVTCRGKICRDPLEILEESAEGGWRGGIWKHNVRCDLFNNYYYIQFPWEIELVESVGQTVETLRSVEYQLECYTYKGDLNNDCGDRFHELNYNFDQAVIYNTEQVSGLLRMYKSPRSKINWYYNPDIVDYPIIMDDYIKILFTKEEQKYRFDMFWDVTMNRGEFDPNWNQVIWNTELNGYIRSLNPQNLNYEKHPTERKKFRHYWNKIWLSKGVNTHIPGYDPRPTWEVPPDHEVDNNVYLHKTKMLLRLANTKLNKSHR